MVAAGDHVRAVGWLHPDHPYPKGPVPVEFLAQLHEFSRLSIECIEALGFGLSCGPHQCEFCRNLRHMGLLNFGVPSGDVLYVAPELVSHYVEDHKYAPPAEFVAAVLVAPLPGTAEYNVATRRFRELQAEYHERQLDRTLDAVAQGAFEAGGGEAAIREEVGRYLLPQSSDILARVQAKVRVLARGPTGSA